jgi:Na+-driven multidrug efflux pump
MVFCRRLIKGSFKFSVALVKRIIDIGWPAGLLQILWQLGAMALFLILSFLPKNNIEIIAAFTNGLKIESAIFLPAFAFSMACAVIVGNSLGKQESEGAFTSGIITAILGVIIVSVMTLIVMANAKIIASFLSNDEIVIRESTRYIYIALISEPFMAWGVILAGALNGAGDTRSVMAIVALSVWLVRIPLSYLLAIYLGIGVVAVWWSMNLSILAQTIFISRRYFSKKWAK